MITRNKLEYNKFKIIVLFCILVSSNLYAQKTLFFIAERDTTAFKWGRDIDSDKSIFINTGDIIYSKTDVSYSMTFRDSFDWHLLININEADDIYWTLAKYFYPQSTIDFFGNDIFIDYPMDRFNPNIGQPNDPQIAVGDVNEMWVPEHYRAVLSGKNRDILRDIQPGIFAFDHWIEKDYFPWYGNTQADIQNGRAMFYNSVIKLGIGTHFAVENIINKDYGYLVFCVISVRDLRWRGAFLYGSSFWDVYKPGDAVTLFLYIDGDYLDIYVNGNDMHLGTFIKVQKEFIKQYQSLIRTNTCDLTNVIWPRRAEGSTGIPPIFEIPDSLKLESTEEESSNTDNKNDKDVKPLPFWVWIVIGAGIVGGVMVLRKKK